MGQPAGATKATNPFNTDPSGVEFFVGRHKELLSLDQWLAAIQNHPQHGCVIGRPGEGKTSFLQKAQSVAQANGMIACRPRLDAKRSTEENLHSIIEKLLDAIDSSLQLKLRDEWKSGKVSRYRVPKESQVRTDDLVNDLQTIASQVNNRACLICLDDGQNITPSAFATLRNTLQDLGRGYMLLMALRNDSPSLNNRQEGQRFIKEFGDDSPDTGSSRLFGLNFLSLGPFDTQGDANDSITTRLRATPIQFPADIVTGIGRITGRYPETMMILANKVYSLTEAANATHADPSKLSQAFIETQRTKVDKATEFCGQESPIAKKVYKSALQFDDVFTPLRVATELIGSGGGLLTPEDLAVEPVRPALDRLVGANFCKQPDAGQYQWIDPILTHALRIAVG